jgi:hypothetical protein
MPNSSAITRARGCCERAYPAAAGCVVPVGWSRPYMLGVLRHWKMTAAYCQAILRHDQRNCLDGVPAEPVGAEAKDLAANQPGGQLATRKAKKKAAKGRGPAAVKPPPASAPPIEPQERVRERLRAAVSTNLAILGELERKVLWLASWTIHHANHVRENADGLKARNHHDGALFPHPAGRTR